MSAQLSVGRIANPSCEKAGDTGLSLVTSVKLAESPSLSASTGMDVPAYELKFLLTEQQARAVEERALRQLIFDPHADPELGNAYQTTSLYCDTTRFDVFHRLGPHKRRKHRLRRYADTDEIYLERKTKWGERVKKRRSLIPLEDLSQLDHPLSATTWPGHWFHRHLLRRGLRPVCRIAYERVAFLGNMTEGPMRLTFDRHVRGILTNDWNVESFNDGTPILQGQVICEFKFQAFLPTLFKEIIHSLRLTPCQVSKYRTFMRASRAL